MSDNKQNGDRSDAICAARTAPAPWRSAEECVTLGEFRIHSRVVFLNRDDAWSLGAGQKAPIVGEIVQIYLDTQTLRIKLDPAEYTDTQPCNVRMATEAEILQDLACRVKRRLRSD
jgi:hypothetical protein